METENQKLSRFEVFSLLGIALILLLICYSPWLLGEKDFVLVDCQYTYQPVCDFIGHWLRQGILPLWNPRAYCGFSEIAVISPSLFYPLNFLLFLLPFSQGEAIYLLTHQLFGGVAAYLYCRCYIRDRPSLIFAAFSLMFCGYMFAVQKYPDFAAGVCFLVFCLWASVQIFRQVNSASYFYVIALSVSTFMLIATGRPEIILPSAGFILIQIFFEAARAKFENQNKTQADRRIVQSLCCCAFALIVAVAMAAPVIWPGYEWLKVSKRSLGLAPSEVFQWSASGYDLLSIFFWFPFGDLEMPRFDEGTLHGLLKTTLGVQIPFFSPAFMGSAFLVCLICGFLSSTFQLRSKCIFAVLCLMGLLGALGWNTPVAPFLLKCFPSLAVLRYPIKLIVFFLLPAIYVASNGFTAIVAREKSVQTILQILSAAFVLLGIIAPILYFNHVFAQLLGALSTANDIVLRASELQQGQVDLLKSCLFTGATGAIFCLTALIPPHFFKSQKPARRTILLVLSIIPMLFFGIASQQRAAPGGYYSKQPELDVILSELLRQDKKSAAWSSSRLSYLIFEPLCPSSQYLQEQNLPYAIAMTKFGRDVLLPNSHFSGALNVSNGYSLSEIGFMSYLYENSIEACSVAAKPNSQVSDYPIARMCAITNSRFALTQIYKKDGSTVPLLDSALFDLKREDKRLNVRIFKTRNCGERYYFASRVEEVVWQELGKLLISTQDKTLMGDQTTYIPRGAFQQLKEELKRPKQVSNKIDKSELALELKNDTPGRTEFVTRKNNPAVLVLRDSIYPGWTARIDGKPVEVHRANLINMAVIIPAGEHSVIFEYSPESFWLASKISLLGILVLCLTPFWSRGLQFILFHRRRSANDSLTES